MNILDLPVPPMGFGVEDVWVRGNKTTGYVPTGDVMNLDLGAKYGLRAGEVSELSKTQFYVVFSTDVYRLWSNFPHVEYGWWPCAPEDVVFAYSILAESCDCPSQGDVAPLAGPGDAVVNVLDVVATIDFVFRSGPELPKELLCPANRGDINGDGTIDILDVVKLIDYVFRSGPIPLCPCTGVVEVCP